MIRTSDVLVTIERGMTTVEVGREGIVAEVRDYDVEQASVTHVELWTDPTGRRCARRYVTKRGTGSLASYTGKDLERFARDLEEHTDLATKIELSPSDDGLHVLQIGGVDFYFNANGTGYDGWGRALGSGENRPA